jgi:hypothetical protein
MACVDPLIHRGGAPGDHSRANVPGDGNLIETVWLRPRSKNPRILGSRFVSRSTRSPRIRAIGPSKTATPSSESAWIDETHRRPRIPRFADVDVKRFAHATSVGS